MKKSDKELEEKIAKEFQQAFEDVDVPELPQEKLNELRKAVEKNKPVRKRIVMWRSITAIASAMCLIALIIRPTVLMLNKNDNPPTQPPIYYGRDEATKIVHTLEETENIIATNFPKYNFIFDELNISLSTGYYNPTNNQLLSLEIKGNEIAIPYTNVEINIIANEYFTFDENVLYTDNAEHTITNNYELYKKVQEDTFVQNMYGYIIFENHEIYIHFDVINETLFDKFI